MFFLSFSSSYRPEQPHHSIHALTREKEEEDLLPKSGLTPRRATTTLSSKATTASARICSSTRQSRGSCLKIYQQWQQQSQPAADSHKRFYRHCWRASSPPCVCPTFILSVGSATLPPPCSFFHQSIIFLEGPTYIRVVLNSSCL